jgi:hypothetical protein
MIQVADSLEGKYEFFFLMLEPLEVGKSVTVFDKVAFDEIWNNEQMQELSELNIHIQAYGVQTVGMSDCMQAMETAFPDHFPFETDIK